MSCEAESIRGSLGDPEPGLPTKPPGIGAEEFSMEAARPGTDLLLCKDAPCDLAG